MVNCNNSYTVFLAYETAQIQYMILKNTERVDSILSSIVYSQYYYYIIIIIIIIILLLLFSSVVFSSNNCKLISRSIGRHFLLGINTRLKLSEI